METDKETETERDEMRQGKGKTEREIKGKR